MDTLNSVTVEMFRGKLLDLVDQMTILGDLLTNNPEVDFMETDAYEMLLKAEENLLDANAVLGGE